MTLMYGGQRRGEGRGSRCHRCEASPYRSTREIDALDELADPDGAVPIPAVAGEVPAAERLRALLERAWGDAWSQAKLAELLSQAGAGGKDLETLLRESFFASHAKLFHNRPF